MTPETILSLSQDALWLTLQLVSPLLLTALSVGVTVGLFQAATQINEMTLSFIPKLLAVGGVLLTTGAWMLRTMTEYTRHLVESIPTLLH
ncbi:flagellar biosynthetic protein FliQ [Solimonas aquatica]|uniref:Flagellar biosynthetic protein FliQ n=1 Tax=Solimonas aquatica TaxID=489703 RepID=A0A1H9HKE8_9GAMM|nr:flagellar biosynthesis protein FliQ [Solimonas aquatica]SEQ62783.1 flagellar biosynthetic protein FliQ [Solimonas aquatica]